MSVFEATGTALRLLLTGDSALWLVVGTSLSIALVAVLLAIVPALVCAYLLAGRRFPGQAALIALLHALLATPTVLIGLVLFLLLSRAGPLGALELLFTPAAVAIGQFCIAVPIIAAFAYNTLRPRLVLIHETSITLGATRVRAMLTVWSECRIGIVTALLAGFGRVVSEVGCALLVGGNIVGSTRTLPTAIAIDTAQGQFTQGIALGIVLLVLAIVTSLSMVLLQPNNPHD